MKQEKDEIIANEFLYENLVGTIQPTSHSCCCDTRKKAITIMKKG